MEAVPHVDVDAVFQEATKLNAENKITQRNAWEIRLLEHLNLKTAFARGKDFRHVSMLIDAAARCYSMRVDSLQSSATSAVAQLSRISAVNGDSESESEHDDECPFTRRAKKKKPTAASRATLARAEDISGHPQSVLPPLFCMANALLGSSSAESWFSLSLQPGDESEYSLSAALACTFSPAAIPTRVDSADNEVVRCSVSPCRSLSHASFCDAGGDALDAFPCVPSDTEGCGESMRPNQLARQQHDDIQDAEQAFQKCAERVHAAVTDGVRAAAHGSALDCTFIAPSALPVHATVQTAMTDTPTDMSSDDDENPLAAMLSHWTFVQPHPSRCREKSAGGEQRRGSGRRRTGAPPRGFLSYPETIFQSMAKVVEKTSRKRGAGGDRVCAGGASPGRLALPPRGSASIDLSSEESDPDECHSAARYTRLARLRGILRPPPAPIWARLPDDDVQGQACALLCPFFGVHRYWQDNSLPSHGISVFSDGSGPGSKLKWSLPNMRRVRRASQRHPSADAGRFSHALAQGADAPSPAADSLCLHDDGYDAGFDDGDCGDLLHDCRAPPSPRAAPAPFAALPTLCRPAAGDITPRVDTHVRASAQVDVSYLKASMWQFLTGSSGASADADMDPSAQVRLQDVMVAVRESAGSRICSDPDGVSPSMYFLCLLHLANERGLYLWNDEDDDLWIRSARGEFAE